MEGTVPSTAPRWSPLAVRCPMKGTPDVTFLQDPGRGTGSVLGQLGGMSRA